MQPSRKVTMKSFYDYEHGEIVREGDSYESGKVVDMAAHPTRPIGFLLLKSERGYTTYVCSTNACAGLALTRDVPAAVVVRFSETILGAAHPLMDRPMDRPKGRPEGVKKYPVVPVPGVAVEPEKLSVQELAHEQEEQPEPLRLESPYFDFV